jgi:hypothetical protein
MVVGGRYNRTYTKMEDPTEAAGCWGKRRENSKKQWPFNGPIYRVEPMGEERIR